MSLNGVSERISQARLDAGMTQRSVARDLDVTIGTVQAWEYDRANLTLNRAAQLSELYKVSLDWIAFGYERVNEDPRIRQIQVLLNEKTP
jgi:transcriptional regulator with XRE-family HTH domain